MKPRDKWVGWSDIPGSHSAAFAVHSAAQTQTLELFKPLIFNILKCHALKHAWHVLFLLVADVGKDIFDAKINGEVLTLRYRRAKPSPATLQTSFEWSPDLSIGSWVAFLPDGPTDIITDLGDAQIVESSFPLTAPVRTRMFVRAVYRDGP